MKFTEQKFIPVLFGNDINVYSVARAFYEKVQRSIGRYSARLYTVRAIKAR